MKHLSVLLLLVFSFSVYADYKSEVKAIEKFEMEEFINDKNYPPKKPGVIPEINKAFYDKLLADPQSLKYFMVLNDIYRIVGLYKKDKSFALSLESKFGGKKLDKSMWEKVFAYVADPILKESNAEQKKAISTRAGVDGHYEKSLALLNSAPSFK
jgi:hypothetical protein